MDRTLVYAGQVPRALDNLLLGRFAMVGLAKLSEAVLGTSTVVSAGSFAVTPGGGLNIAVAPGQIYQLESIEPTTESALNVDGHQVLKQGVSLDAQTFTLAPPTAVGYAQNYLIQVAYDDIPTGSVVLSFQNPTPVLDPATNAYKYVTYPGPGGNGAQSYTILQGGVSIIPKPGTAAPAGTQTTPTPDAGYVGLFVVTLAYGATSVSSGNVSSYASAPVIPVTLPGVPAGVQAGTWTYGSDTGSANNYAVTLSPNNGAPTLNQRVFVKFASTNTTTSPVLSLNGTQPKALLRRDGSAPVVGDVPAQGWRWIFFDGAAWRFEGSVTSDIASSSTALTIVKAAGTSFNTIALASTQRNSASAAQAGALVPVVTLANFTKLSSTSLLRIGANFYAHSPVIPGQGNGAVTVRAILTVVSSGQTFSDDRPLNCTTLVAGGGASGSGGNTQRFRFANVPAGTLSLSLSFKRDDNLSWTTIYGATGADLSGLPTPNPSLFEIDEVESLS